MIKNFRQRRISLWLKKLKIISHSLQKSLLLTLEFPPNIGGIANYYHQIARNNKSIKVLHLKISKNRLSWIRCFLPILNKIKKNKIDYLQIGQILPLGYFGLMFKLTLKKPYLVYVHGLDVLQSSLSSWKKFWIKIILRQAQSIIANSNYVKERTSKKYNIDVKKFKVNYPKIDIEAIESAAKQLTQIERQNDTKIILSVGRLVPRKGFDKVIEALNKIMNYELRIMNCEYWILGNGQDRGRLESIVKKYNLEDKVKFLGQISTPQIYQHYKSCDIFIMPCREINGDVEGFGIVFLEAAAFAKPAIAGKSGGAPEAVIDGVTGLLVDPMSNEEISQALIKLLTDEELAAKLGQNAYERVRSEFS